MDSRLTLENFKRMIGAYGCPAQLHVSKYLQVQAFAVVSKSNCNTEIVTLPDDADCNPAGLVTLNWRAVWPNGGVVYGDGSLF